MAVAGFLRRQGQKFADYWKAVGHDYYIVLTEAVQESTRKPWKAAATVTFLGGLTYAYKTNPTYEDMMNDLRERRQKMVLIPNSEHNPEADSVLVERSMLLNTNKLHYYNLWFFSLLLRSVHDDKVRHAHSQNSDLKLFPWQELSQNLVDVGFLGRWRRLDEKFVDYDLNLTELNQLPS